MPSYSNLGHFIVDVKEIKVRNKYFTCFLTQEEIEQRVSALALELDRDYAEKRPLLIVVLNGAFRFAGDLVKSLNIPVEIAFIKLSSYQGTESTGEVEEVMGIATSKLQNREVILVEDIIDTGLTAQKILNTLGKTGAKSLQFMSLLLKPESLQIPIHVKYVGFEIPNEFVVGYGLDYDEFGRELNDIYKVKI